MTKAQKKNDRITVAEFARVSGVKLLTAYYRVRCARYALLDGKPVPTQVDGLTAVPIPFYVDETTGRVTFDRSVVEKWIARGGGKARTYG